MSEHQASLFTFTAKIGPHAIGLRVVKQYDYTRVYRAPLDPLGQPYARERARPLQTLIWYPAAPSRTQSMTVRDYLNLWASETDFEAGTMPSRAKEWLAGMKPTLDSHMWAISDAPAEPGTFPVVIYAPSFSSVAWENADLCEYLASHGYVVIATPNMGETTRNMTEDIAGINAQARDIGFLISYARTLPNADVSRIAVAGFSWGGISNLFAAARDNRIGALVALDGSMRYRPGMVHEVGDVHPENMTIPLLYFSQGEATLEHQARHWKPTQNVGANVLNSWTSGDLVMVRMLGMTHRQFSSMFQRNEDVWSDFADKEFPDFQKADYGREDGSVNYGWVAEYTRQFLDAYLKGSTAARSFLQRSPAENELPRHQMVVDYRTARDLPTSFEAFRAAVTQRGFAQAETVYVEMRTKNPQFQLSEIALNDWAEQLIDANTLISAALIRRWEKGRWHVRRIGNPSRNTPAMPMQDAG
jgi:pimeloyl-ACP methyl ester carboxylesterase